MCLIETRLGAGSSILSPKCVLVRFIDVFEHVSNMNAFRLAHEVSRVLLCNAFILSIHLNLENYRLSSEERQRIIYSDQTSMYAQNQQFESIHVVMVDDIGPCRSNCLMASFYISFS